MKTRIIIIEVPDTRAQDLLEMAIQSWNESTEDHKIRHRTMFSTPVGDWKEDS